MNELPLMRSVRSPWAGFCGVLLAIGAAPGMASDLEILIQRVYEHQVSQTD